MTTASPRSRLCVPQFSAQVIWLHCLIATSKQCWVSCYCTILFTRKPKEVNRIRNMFTRSLRRPRSRIISRFVATREYSRRSVTRKQKKLWTLLSKSLSSTRKSQLLHANEMRDTPICCLYKNCCVFYRIVIFYDIVTLKTVYYYYYYYFFVLIPSVP